MQNSTILPPNTTTKQYYSLFHHPLMMQNSLARVGKYVLEAKAEAKWKEFQHSAGK
jgi:hypothetical protein